MALSAIQTGERFTDEETEHIRRCFHRDGYYAFGRLMEDEEVEALRADMQRKWDDPRMHEPARDQIRGNSLMRMFEYSYAFRDLIVREPFASLAEAILGDDCHCMSQNALYTPPNPKAAPRTVPVDGTWTTWSISRCRTACRAMTPPCRRPVSSCRSSRR